MAERTFKDAYAGKGIVAATNSAPKNPPPVRPTERVATPDDALKFLRSWVCVQCFHPATVIEAQSYGQLGLRAANGLCEQHARSRTEKNAYLRILAGDPQ